MFYIGIVEDNKDPKKLGRLKIRIFGIHTENRNKSVDDISKHITTNDLPWCYPSMPITNSCIDGISDFSTIIKGTKVLCCFLDVDKQQPICLGVLPSLVEELPDFDKGFSDPDGNHPKEEYLDESSISRLARNEKLDETIVQVKKDNLEEFEVCGTTITEPETEYDAKYPNNRVIETASGHIIELDDTEGKERIHIAHKSGTFVEIFPDGRVVYKADKDIFTLVNGDSNIYVKDDENKRIGAKCNLEIIGETKVIFNEKVSIEAKKELKIEASEKVIIDASGDVEINGDNTNIVSTGNIKLDATGGTIDIDCANCTLDATGNVVMSATLISLN